MLFLKEQRRIRIITLIIGNAINVVVLNATAEHKDA